jgi:2-amino-4-hydroxy-6-hydroxymethyldihydropteridine diphosphokinase
LSRALIGMGGNVGDPLATLDAAVGAFCDGAVVLLVARSSTYLTEPWGVEDQPRFANLCLDVATDLPPRALLERALSVEAHFGRDRSKERRWGPRVLDIDLLAYDDVGINAPCLQLPHPRIGERAFVLAPLAEIAPQWRIGAETVATLADRVDKSGVVRLPGGAG